MSEVWLMFLCQSGFMDKYSCVSFAMKMYAVALDNTSQALLWFSVFCVLLWFPCPSLSCHCLWLLDSLDGEHVFGVWQLSYLLLFWNQLVHKYLVHSTICRQIVPSPEGRLRVHLPACQPTYCSAFLPPCPPGHVSH